MVIKYKTLTVVEYISSLLVCLLHVYSLNPSVYFVLVSKVVQNILLSLIVHVLENILELVISCCLLELLDHCQLVRACLYPV